MISSAPAGELFEGRVHVNQNKLSRSLSAITIPSFEALITSCSNCALIIGSGPLQATEWLSFWGARLSTCHRAKWESIAIYFRQLVRSRLTQLQDQIDESTLSFPARCTARQKKLPGTRRNSSRQQVSRRGITHAPPSPIFRDVGL